MNTIWSDYVQNIDTLYCSRALRFSDRYREAYQRAFQIDGKKKILEIGCGPGALSESLARWYPDAEIIGSDRDSSFIAFASRQAPNVRFLEADATALPFAEESFDVVVSNTVQEHVEPSKFFGEQYRVLKKGGVCLVLSARRGISIEADCISAPSEREESIWERVKPFYLESGQKYEVGRYAMSESELPSAMERYGFSHVSTNYLAINLTPDHPENSREEAHAMIDAHRRSALDAVSAWRRIAPKEVSEEALLELKKIICQKYDKRIQLYDAGEKQWDTSVSLTMVLRGIK
ncbi:MAG: class I SAM-dependent methyltransferase [Clostridia bacterium]|nr:class I SAM-dependent methyltransferase [Clostridia bacterium]